jgi:hypothetical protein
VQRLQLVMMPHRRQLTVHPTREPGRRPGVDFTEKTPEQRRAAVDAANARKAPGVRVDFNCRHHPRDCIGCADVTDDRLAKFCNLDAAIGV